MRRLVLADDGHDHRRVDGRVRLLRRGADDDRAAADRHAQRADHRHLARWFLTRAKQAEGVARAKADLGQLETQQKALEACTGATAKQQALIDPALAAITDVRAFAKATLAIVKGRTITQAQKALRKERPKIEQLTKRLTESLAALSTQWEVWKHDHQGS